MVNVASFKISKNDHIIDVQQFDDIDFVCPYYSTVTSHRHRRRHRHHEYYVIYRVTLYLLTYCVEGQTQLECCVCRQCM